MKQAVYQNPLLAGFYPDPSICRVGEDYYMVTSTFTVFPGLPIFHSRDLANWAQIGHILERSEQINLTAHWHSGGLYAPTLRHYNGRFYLVCTNVGAGGHFYMTADQAEGPWSPAVYLDGEGIDPDLFQDTDGRLWFSATRGKANERYSGDNEIWLREFDPGSGCLSGETHVIWGGYAQTAVWTEAPHIYYRAPYYYVMTAEGGTGHEHAVMVGRSESLFGPYEACHLNPILTHRHLGRDYPVVNVGHADLVETQQGDWYIVALASRPYGGYYRNLGRETFIGAVSWEDGWPIVNAGHGRLLASGTINLPEEKLNGEPNDYLIDFSQSRTWDRRVVCIRGLQLAEAFRFIDGKGLRLTASDDRLDLPGSPSALFCRQQHMALEFEVTAAWPENLMQGISVGLTAFQDNHYYYRIALKPAADDSWELTLVRRTGGEEQCLERVRLEEIDASTKPNLRFKLKLRGQELCFSCRIGERDIALETMAGGQILSPDYSGSFLGSMIGAYIQDDGDLISVSKADEANFATNRQPKNYTDTTWILTAFSYRARVQT